MRCWRSLSKRNKNLCITSGKSYEKLESPCFLCYAVGTVSVILSIDLLVAAKFVCKTSEWKITNLSLQKILYFCHLVFLGENEGKPLFNERFLAWELGPVLRSVYDYAKERGVQESYINESVFHNIESIKENNNRKEVATLAFITKHLAKFSSSTLVEWSHRDGGAWKKNYWGKYDYSPIPNEDIKNEYSAILRGDMHGGKEIKKIILNSKKEKLKDKLILALDFSSIEKSEEMIGKLEDKINFFKIGMEVFFQRKGIDFAEKLKDEGKKIFFDAKSLDIPRTVEAAVNSISELNFDFMSIHTLSHSLLKNLGENIERRNTQLIGVTLLTSISATELKFFGIKQTPEDMVLTLAKQAMEVGRLDGLVASGREIGVLREIYPDAILIAPGIRPQGSEADDQRRTTTPREAIIAGADHIVVGRPITQAEDPRGVVERIFEEIEQAQSCEQETEL